MQIVIQECDPVRRLSGGYRPSSIGTCGRLENRWPRPGLLLPPDEPDEHNGLVSPGLEHRCQGSGARLRVGSAFAETRVKIVTSEGSQRCVERRVEQVDPRASGQRGEVETGDGFGDDECLSQAGVPHCANRSRISLSRSVISRSLPMNSSSCRTRSTSAVNASTTSVLTLIPRPRATTSTVEASSSGSRTVVVFVMQS